MVDIGPSEQLDTSGRSFSCSECNRKFENKSSLTKHILNVHCDTRAHICGKCGRKFLEESSLRRHLLTHKDVECNDGAVHGKRQVRTYFCKKCEETFEGRTEFQKHSRRMHALSLECSKCGRKFNDRSNLRRHIVALHSQERPHACEKCDKKFKQKRDVQRHSIIHCENAMRPFICGHCDKGFLCKSSLRRHIIAIHTHERLYACEQCNKTFKQKRDIKRHSITHSKNRIKPFICHHCDGKFLCKSSIKRHIISVHTHERPYACNVCYKTFKVKRDIERHSITHCKDASNLFFCHHCNEKFTRKSNVVRHILVMHHNSSKQICVCPTCGKAFLRKDNCQRHVLTHLNSKRKSYSRKKYGDKFKCKDDFKAHTYYCSRLIAETTKSEYQLGKSTTVELQQSSFHSKGDDDESNFVCKPELKHQLLENISNLDSLSPANEVEEKSYDCAVPANSCPACCESFESYDLLIKHAKLCDKYDSLLSKEKEKLVDERQYQCSIRSSSHSEDDDESDYICEPELKHQLLANTLHSDYLFPANEAEEKSWDRAVVPTNSSPIEYNTCPACYESFERYDLLIKHAKFCDKYDSLLSEEKEKLGDNMLCEKQYQCSICYLSFVFLNSFISHLKHKHRTTFFYHKCTESCYH